MVQQTNLTKKQKYYISEQQQRETTYVGIKNIPKADSHGILNALEHLLTVHFGDEWRQKVVGFGSDGASVMTGSKNGVIKKLRDDLDRPFILGVHCSAHRLELAFKDACKSIPLYTKISQLMENLYLFYRNSSLNRSNLKIAFDSYDRNPLMPTRVNGTHWVPHTVRAVKNMMGGYGPIVSHLKQVMN